MFVVASSCHGIASIASQTTSVQKVEHPHTNVGDEEATPRLMPLLP